MSALQQQLQDLLAKSPTFREMVEPHRTQMTAALLESSDGEMQKAIKTLQEEQEGMAKRPNLSQLLADMRQAKKNLERAFLEDREQGGKESLDPESLLKGL